VEVPAILSVVFKLERHHELMRANISIPIALFRAGPAPNIRLPVQHLSLDEHRAMFGNIAISRANILLT
jgi:hypothetical protein